MDNYCKDLTLKNLIREFPYVQEPDVSLTERGLVAFSAGSTRFYSFAAMVVIARNCHHPSLQGITATSPFWRPYGSRVSLHLAHAKKLKMLSSGECNLGLHSGFESHCKVETRDSPFGDDKALLVSAARLETMQYLWMSSCSISNGACELQDQEIPPSFGGICSLKIIKLVESPQLEDFSMKI
ncbi:protein TRANSPORT INHIBITOR RESPONSE 1-like [Solanum tuberosum]|uniref:Transport inhibitor response 1 n=1 Tax=Solanum tuberosum TaxID=4113 RepID=M1CPS4_SOLTU|nr:PREDICTED: protein TRANSPORT INHIBITOR RESPONSE 1-like [Solanum tuberosum]